MDRRLGPAIPDITLPDEAFKDLLPHKALLEEEEDPAERERLLAQTEAKTSYWWHRNFMGKHDAALSAVLDAVEDEVRRRIPADDLAMWHDLTNENMGDRTADNFTGAGRSLLVETERELLMPWNCTLDVATTFPDFMELVAATKKCFKGGSVEEIMHGLEKEGTPFAESCLQRMRAMSPLGLQVMFRQIDEAAELSLEEAMQMEYRVGVRLLTSPGFAWETEENADPSIHSALKDPDVTAGELFELLSEFDELKLPERTLDGRRHTVGIGARFERRDSTRGSA